VSLWILIPLILLVLIVGGMIARLMFLRRSKAEFGRRLERADHDLAEAAALDRGWDRERLEAAARSNYASERGREPDQLLLIEVLDRPGTEEDLAVFRAEAEGRREMLTLGRRGDEWVLERIE
jgi:hypothetical protein